MGEANTATVAVVDGGREQGMGGRHHGEPAPWHLEIAGAVRQSIMDTTFPEPHHTRQAVFAVRRGPPELQTHCMAAELERAAEWARARGGRRVPGAGGRADPGARRGARALAAAWAQVPGRGYDAAF